MNEQLAAFMRDSKGVHEPLPKIKAELPLYRPAKWRIHDRLSEQDRRDIVTAFKNGVTQKALAAQYHIDARSVRKRLREAGAI